MSTLSKYILLISALIIGFNDNAYAALYGFSAANPYVEKERTLHIGTPPKRIINFRSKMRDNIDMLAEYAHSRIPDFQILIHEGEELLNKSLWEYHLEGYNEARKKGINAEDPSFLYKLGTPAPQDSKLAGEAYPDFIEKIDAIVLNNVFCSNRKLSKVMKQPSFRLVSIDHCPSEEYLDEAIQESFGEKVLFHGFTNLDTAFNNVRNHPIINENAKNISAIKDAQNILFVDDDSRYKDKYSFLAELQNSNYDVIVISPLFNGKTPYTKEEIHSLKFKKNGMTRLIIAEMNISEADPTAYYWRKDWKIGSPTWLTRASLVNEDTVIVRYWDNQWKKIIADYFQSIINTGYSGVFFTGTQNHAHFERQLPLE